MRQNENLDVARAAASRRKYEASNVKEEKTDSNMQQQLEWHQANFG